MKNERSCIMKSINLLCILVVLSMLLGWTAGVWASKKDCGAQPRAGAKELVIEIGDGGDGIGCDHSALGDAKLLTGTGTAVKPVGKLSTSWGAIKASY